MTRSWRPRCASRSRRWRSSRPRCRRTRRPARPRSARRCHPGKHGRPEGRRARPDVVRIPSLPAHPRRPAYLHGGRRCSARPRRGRPRLAAVRRRRTGELSAVLPRRVAGGLDQLAGRQPRGVLRRGRRQRGGPAHLLGRPADQGHRVDHGGRGAGPHRGEPAGRQVPTGLRHPRRRHAAPPAAVRRRHRRGHRGGGYRPADRQRGRRARVLEALPRRPDRQAVDRHSRGSPVHPGARGPGRPASQPDDHRRAAFLPVRPRGHRQRLLLRAGRQRRHPAYRS